MASVYSITGVLQSLFSMGEGLRNAHTLANACPHQHLRKRERGWPDPGSDRGSTFEACCIIEDGGDGGAVMPGPMLHDVCSTRLAGMRQPAGQQTAAPTARSATR